MKRTGMAERSRTILWCIALPVFATGCATPSEPPPPPSGGQAPNMDFALFASSVEPVLQQKGCDAGGDCHGGGIRGSLALSPAGAKDVQFDFTQVSRQVSVSNPDGSPILTEPLALAAGGTPHPYKPFVTTADSEYIAIRMWVENGTQP
jgi:hypothetical protein